MAKFMILTPDNSYLVEYLLHYGFIDGAPDADLIFDLASAEVSDDRPAAEAMYAKPDALRHAKKRAAEENWRRRTGETMRDLGLTANSVFHGKEASKYRHGRYNPYAHDWTYEKAERHGARFADKRAIEHGMDEYERDMKDLPYIREMEDEFFESPEPLRHDADPYGYNDYHSDMEHGFFEIMDLLGSDHPGSIRRFLHDVIEDGRSEELSKEAEMLLERLDRLFPGMENCDMIKGIKLEGES